MISARSWRRNWLLCQYLGVGGVSIKSYLYKQVFVQCVREIEMFVWHVFCVDYTHRYTHSTDTAFFATLLGNLNVYSVVTSLLFILQDQNVNGYVFVWVKCMFPHKTSKYDYKAKLLCTIASAQSSLREVIWELLTPVFVCVVGKLALVWKSSHCDMLTRGNIHALCLWLHFH